MGGHCVPGIQPERVAKEQLMDDVRDLKELQLDALREVANIGGGHAATALSQMTNRRIMISVPTIYITHLDDVPQQLGDGRTVVVGVLMHMMGDLTGRTLLLVPEANAQVLCDLLLSRAVGTTHSLGVLEQSALKEAGNILGAAYLNALSDFMKMMLLPSVPSLVIDSAAAVLTSAYLNFGRERDYVFCIETRFEFDEAGRVLPGYFLLLPDVVSLRAILDAIGLS
jgi:chemotaxis protein CheC